VVLLRRLPPFGDFPVCGISTQLQQRVADFDEEIAAGDPEFAASGLKAASLIRLGVLAVLPDSALLGRIGSLSSTRRFRLLANLCRQSRFARPARHEEVADCFPLSALGHSPSVPFLLSPRTAFPISAFRASRF
jgi:mRNA interferase MazF